MKTQLPTFSRTATAVLSAVTIPADGNLAVMSAALTDADDGWYQLLPAGAFSARDGRPHDVPGGKWLMDDLAFTFLQTSFDLHQQPVVIDYNHQTVNKDVTGSEAIAAGWINNGHQMCFRPGEGVFIRPELTEKAKAHIAAKEYRYLSAVFHYDRESGRPYELRMVALTNDPGVTGMKALAALSASLTLPNTENSHVNKLFISLLGKLGITLAEGAEPTAEQSTAALSALDVLLASKQKNTELEGQVAVLSAKVAQPGGEVDLGKYVPVETYNALVTSYATLSAQTGSMTVDKVIEEARTAGKIIAAEEDYLKQFGTQQGVAALSAMLEKRPAIPALTTTQNTPTESGKKGTATLSAADLAVIAATGVTEADFLKARELEQK